MQSIQKYNPGMYAVLLFKNLKILHFVQFAFMLEFVCFIKVWGPVYKQLCQRLGSNCFAAVTYRNKLLDIENIS